MTIVWVNDVTPLDEAHMNELEQITRKGAANGYAPLGADGLVPAVNLPPIPPLVLTDADIPASIARDAEVMAVLAGYQTRNEKGVPNGFPDLDATGKVPAFQLPPVNLSDADIPASITRDAEMAAAIAAGDVLKVDKDSVLDGGTRILQNKLLAGDANQNFGIRADGLIAWGPGGANPLDIYLLRDQNDGSLLVSGVSAGLGRLKVDQLISKGAVTGNFNTDYSTILSSNLGRPAVVFGILNDASLYRQAAGILRTDGTLDANALTVNGVPVGGAVDITGKVDKDSVTVAATRIVASKLLAGDANPAFRVLGNGKIEWGTGGAAALDVSLTRGGAGVLQTPNRLLVNELFSTVGVTAGEDVSAGRSVFVDLNGTGQRVFWGASADTSLYRSAAGVLKTDGRFDIAGLALINGGIISQRPGLTDSAFHILSSTDGGWRFKVDISGKLGWHNGTDFGTPDTNLYRASAGVLKTDGELQAGSGLVAAAGSAQQIWAGNWGGYARVFWGNGFDTSIYRASAGVLQTDALNVSSLTFPNAGGNVVTQDGLLLGAVAGSTNSLRVFINGVPYKIPIYA